MSCFHHVFGEGGWLKIPSLRYTFFVGGWVVENTKFTLYVFGGGWWLKNTTFTLHVFGGGWWLKNTKFTLHAGFVQILENLENTGI